VNQTRIWDLPDPGKSQILSHHIDTGSARPIRQPLRRFPPAHVEAISNEVDKLLAQGVIEPASSPWAANVVLVRKRDGSCRCCIDYRQLSNVTIKDAYPVPRMDSCLDAMSGTGWFSTAQLTCLQRITKCMSRPRTWIKKRLSVREECIATVRCHLDYATPERLSRDS